MDDHPTDDQKTFIDTLRFAKTVIRVVGSLYIAVALIALFTGALVGGTFVEKKHGAEGARELVYGTHWFEAILILLAINILASLAVRFPWRLRQTGFVVTHVGILVLAAGCLASRHRGVEAQLAIFEGHANGTAFDSDSQKPFELGFQVYLHKFSRPLDPGSDMASHYSSLVDFLDTNKPPKKLRENVLIKLNEPVDFTDPVSGRTYRLFQSSFAGPWLPGDAEFDQIVGRDHSRDYVYRSVLSVNYDPGRGLKNFGSLMIIVGIALVYYFRRWWPLRPRSNAPRATVGSADRAEEQLTLGATAGSSSSAVRMLILTLFPAILIAATCQATEPKPPGTTTSLSSSASKNNQTTEQKPLNWNAWQHLPVLGRGRVEPLDTFARQAVAVVCGRSDPILTLDGGQARRFNAAELLFAWLAEPEQWEKTPFLLADDPELRALIEVPLVDAAGRRLRYVSPEQAENCPALARRLADLQERAQVAGKDFRLEGLDREVKALFDAYAKFRLLTFDPKTATDPPDRFYYRFRMAGSAWRKLAGNLHTAQQISKNEQIRQAMVDGGTALQKLVGQVHGQEFSLAKTEPEVVKLRQAADKIADSLRPLADRPMMALAIDFQRQAAEMQRALYDNGDELRLVPALNAAALEENRTPGDDSSPWLGLQVLIDGSPEMMRAYPQDALQNVRAAYTETKKVYSDRDAPDRAEKFAAAMNRFADSLRAFGEKVGPLRKELPIQYRDQSLLDSTAYPPPGATITEVLYSRLNPFFWAWVASLVATVSLVLALGRWRQSLFLLGSILLVLGVTATLAGLVFRGCITGLVPLTGMFETVVFVAMYSSLLGLYYAYSPLWSLHRLGSLRQRWHHVTQRRLFAVSGAAVGFIAGVLAYYAPETVMRRGIGSVTPVLRDNFWLAVHVVTIMASYASAAIALILGNISLGYYLFGRYRETDDGRRLAPEPCETLARFTYAPLKITVLLLATGTILGAFWADKSWGRFWSWDPKEVWALISLLVYMLMLHLRHLGLSRDFGMAVTAVFGFTAILFTWYAVNFLLGSGMHSYGSGAGGQYAVGGAVLLQWAFLLAAASQYWSETRRSAE